ncbi:MAG: LacI family DNA-binding transcriptional regulator, partial [Mucilaginibacter sp.]
FDRVYEHKKCPSIYINNYQAAYDITSHLIEQGCKRIAHIGGNQMRNVYADRARGYQQALKDHDIAFDEELLIINDLSARSGTEAAEKILNMKNRPDGVFVANDICAINCMQAVKKAGVKIPANIAFAGFNNDPTSCVIEPNLTTIDYRGHEMGEVAAKVMVDHLIRGDDLQKTQSVILRSELIVRESSLKKKTKNK